MTELGQHAKLEEGSLDAEGRQSNAPNVAKKTGNGSGNPFA
jgi:hypothetical protein